MAAERPRSGYARTAGGMRLHYTVYPGGEPALVCCNGLGVSTFFWKYVIEHFRHRHRIVTWDYRGHGRSSPVADEDPAAFTVEANADDLARVMDAARTERAVLLGHSMGCQVILQAWRQFPRRVAGLVPICGAFGRPLDTFFDTPAIARPAFSTMYWLITTWPHQIQRVLSPLLRSPLPDWIARLGIIDARRASPEDMAPYFRHLSQMDLEVFFRMARAMQEHDAGPWLEEIDVPVLIVAGENDLFTPFRLAVEMQQRIPGAELLRLPGGSHAGLIEHPELLNLRLEKFLRERILPAEQRAANGQRPSASGARRRGTGRRGRSRIQRPAARQDRPA